MSGTFLYVHGTGEASTVDDEARIARQLREVWGVTDWRVVCPPWGAEVGPPDLDVTPALPVGYQAAIVQDAGDALAEAAAEFHAQSVGSAAEVVPAGVQNLGLRILTDVIEKYRLGLTNGVVDFVRNVFFYLNAPDGVREYVDRAIDEAVASRTEPVVVAGHSLGGVIALEALSLRPRDVDLLVTAGSQAPLFSLMGVLPSIGEGRAPFSPWLNVVNPRDPLSFRAGEVFGWAPEVPVDVEVTEPRNLIAAHTGYFDEPELYRLIGERLGLTLEAAGGPVDSGSQPL